MAIACTTCGNQNQDGATVCQYCGASFKQTAPSVPSYDQPTQMANFGLSPPPGGGQPPNTTPAYPTPQPGQGGYQQHYATPQPPSYQPQQYANAQGYGGQYLPQPVGVAPKDPTTGLLLELIPGFFGFMGIGYLWSGMTGIGIALLLGYWVVVFFEIIFIIFTLGLLALCLWPINIVAPVVSAVLLQKKLKEQQALPAGMAQPF